MKISDLQKSKNFKLVQHGEAGCGKTFRAATALRFGKVLFLDTDNKFAGMVPRLIEKFGEAEVNAKLEVEVITGAEQYVQAMQQIDKLAEGFSTIVLDTMSRAFDFSLAAVKAKNPKLDGRAIFGLALEQNLSYLTKLLSMPHNVIVNAHVGSEEMADGSTKLTSTTPGKFGKKLPEFFNEVHYLFVNGNRKHCVQGEPSAMVVTRTVRPKTLLDGMGLFKTDDLSIFDSEAYRAK